MFKRQSILKAAKKRVFCGMNFYSKNVDSHLTLARISLKAYRDQFNGARILLQTHHDARALSEYNKRKHALRSQLIHIEALNLLRQQNGQKIKFTKNINKSLA